MGCHMLAFWLTLIIPMVKRSTLLSVSNMLEKKDGEDILWNTCFCKYFLYCCPLWGQSIKGTGIYHVMLRGINRQDIFEEAEDYWTFIRILSAVHECPTISSSICGKTMKNNDSKFNQRGTAIQRKNDTSRNNKSWPRVTSFLFEWKKPSGRSNLFACYQRDARRSNCSSSLCFHSHAS